MYLEGEVLLLLDHLIVLSRRFFRPLEALDAEISASRQHCTGERPHLQRGAGVGGAAAVAGRGHARPAEGAFPGAGDGGQPGAGAGGGGGPVAGPGSRAQPPRGQLHESADLWDSVREGLRHVEISPGMFTVYLF